MIEVRELVKQFKTSKQHRKENPDSPKWMHAVNHVSFSCKPGRVYSLLGPNGAGKTTTLRMIAAIIKQDAGNISVAGFDTIRAPLDVKRKLGFLTGTTGLYERLTPSEVLRYFARLNGIPDDVFKSRRDELFDRLGIGSFAGKRIGKLSTGMKQKVSIARTLIHDPEVLVFDEPTSGLDVITANNIIELIRERRDAGRTVLFSTHIMGEVSLLSDDLGILHNGKLIFNDTYEQFTSGAASQNLIEEFIRIIRQHDTP